MGLNKNDRSSIIKTAEEKGYSWNSSGNKMINSNGGSVQFSQTGQSVKINQSQYNSTSGAKKSTKW